MSVERSENKCLYMIKKKKQDPLAVANSKFSFVHRFPPAPFTGFAGEMCG